jgi:hypothetical protein
MFSDCSLVNLEDVEKNRFFFKFIEHSKITRIRHYLYKN